MDVIGPEPAAKAEPRDRSSFLLLAGDLGYDRLVDLLILGKVVIHSGGAGLLPCLIGYGLVVHFVSEPSEYLLEVDEQGLLGPISERVQPVDLPGVVGDALGDVLLFQTVELVLVLQPQENHLRLVCDPVRLDETSDMSTVLTCPAQSKTFSKRNLWNAWK